MKYTRLTKEQLEEMHEEFARFLATQQINVIEWQKIKQETPEVAEQEIDIFSDLVWEKVLGNVTHLSKVDAKSVFLFHVEEASMKLIVVKCSAGGIDLTTKEGMTWVLENYKNDAVTIYNAQKPFSDDKKLDIFKLIEQGAAISDGAYYEYFKKLIA